MVATTIWVAPGTGFVSQLGRVRDFRRSRSRLVWSCCFLFGFGFRFVFVINHAGRPVDFLVWVFVALFQYDWLCLTLSLPSQISCQIR
jgi:hypothetical protein